MLTQFLLLKTKNKLSKNFYMSYASESARNRRKRQRCKSNTCAEGPEVFCNTGSRKQLVVILDMRYNCKSINENIKTIMLALKYVHRGQMYIINMRY